MFSDQQQAILRTVVFFDIFKYPLTKVECWRWLYYPKADGQASALKEVGSNLSELEQQGVLKNKNGFWQLASSTDFYDLRQRRYLIANDKIKKLKYWRRVFSWLPSVRFVAIVNSVGYRNPEVDDDIDIFIIARGGKLWLTRGWLTGLAKLFGVRPTFVHQKDGICLSFYLSDKHLCINDVLISHPDVYFHFWLTQMTVLWDDGVGAEFVKANSEWVKYFPNLKLEYYQLDSTSVVDNFIRIIFKLLTLSSWENFWKKIQKNILPLHLNVANNDKGVIINDEVLKFHDHDTRAQYFDMWKSKLHNLGL